jgi:hypothetical protein
LALRNRSNASRISAGVHGRRTPRDFGLADLGGFLSGRSELGRAFRPDFFGNDRTRVRLVRWARMIFAMKPIY